MKESTWEASRRREKKKTLLGGLIVLPVVAAAVVLVVNNRDLIRPSGRENPAATPNRNAPSPPVRNGSASAKAPPSLPEPFSPAAASDDPQQLPQPSLSDPPVADAPSPAHDHSASPEKQAAPDPHAFFSIALPPIPCRLESRKDLVIYLSLELFFSEFEKRTSILFRREDIKVMVMRSVQGKELAEMKIGELQCQLLHDINRLFEHSDITAVKIRNIQVEKADHR